MEYFIFIKSLELGGAERAAVNLSKYLVSRNDSVTFVLLERNNFYSVPNEVKIIYLGETFSNWDRLTFPKYYFSLKKLAANWNPKTSCLMACSLIAVCLIGSLKKTHPQFTCLVFQQHSFNYFTHSWIRRNIVRPIALYFYDNIDYIVVPSQDIRKEADANAFKNKTGVVVNLLDIDTIQEKSKEPLSFNDDAKFRFVNVGRLSHPKHQELLIEAFSKLGRKDVALYFVGSGELETNLKNAAIQHQVTDIVHFVGLQANPFKYMSHCDCFILSSIYEGLPTVIIEAMACGIPVISTDCPTGPRELLAPNSVSKLDVTNNSLIEYGDYGLLIPIRSMEALCMSMNLMINNETLRSQYVEKSKTIVSDYGYPQRFDQFEDIIDKLKNRPRT
jgi:N-acetylgalactosamine-N,N'-diacetylbacillosaminyl-diphospho-undecaprenol 4-alpha-N-acetylgalactosaminyltransferase